MIGWTTFIDAASKQIRCRFDRDVWERGSHPVTVRLTVCRTCPAYAKVGTVEVCKRCGCPLSCKSRVPEEVCPLGRWPVAAKNPPAQRNATGGEEV